MALRFGAGICYGLCGLGFLAGDTVVDADGHNADVVVCSQGLPNHPEWLTESRLPESCDSFEVSYFRGGRDNTTNELAGRWPSAGQFIAEQYWDPNDVQDQMELYTGVVVLLSAVVGAGVGAAIRDFDPPGAS